jgi:hypothetical protein
MRAVADVMDHIKYRYYATKFSAKEGHKVMLAISRSSNSSYVSHNLTGEDPTMATFPSFRIKGTITASQ